ncbi:4'-phosphopantetheinyl transferase family protein [Sneathiella litorea]|uniref:4'-phosphopantetheinyl transferase superfamily protein n=1 Tax=Sneathiella litorea TaxID=2606216 RepID=A0A6L8W651_9PROT|nr:4'-phosphopantetheinyl transferase superfamily protein [Sneathiella litorea]MZR30616.1 4'-phosphopantetheinyl transferase superfamily protein [Sneathiella litorea]
MMAFGQKNTHIYHADIGENGPLDFSNCWQALSPAEKARAERFRFDLHRNRYVRAHGRMRHILSAYLDIAPADISIQTGHRGKPFIEAGDIYFNMSHSADTAVFAVTQSGEIGIDIEMFDRKVEIDDLSRHYYTEAEQMALSGLQETARRELFFWLWTAKEARMKVTGEGLALDPRHIDVTIEAGQLVAYRKPDEPKASLVPVKLMEIAGACSVAGLFEPNLAIKSLDDID